MNAFAAQLGPIHGPTWRSRCGSARITYRADWSENRPFQTYIRGTAGLSFPDYGAALFYMKQRGYDYFSEES
jgi:hypothetical protein